MLLEMKEKLSQSNRYPYLLHVKYRCYNLENWPLLSYDVLDVMKCSVKFKIKIISL